MVSEEDLKSYYNQYHQANAESAWRPPAAYPPFLRLAHTSADHHVLDIGCGTGHLLKSASGLGAHCTGIDISEEALRLARKSAPNAHLSVGSAESLPYPDASFDRVFCTGVMEHFLDMRKGLSEMIRVTRPNGLLCIVVPNDKHWWWLFQRHKGTEQQAINEHLLDLEGWRALFTEQGLLEESVRQDRHWFLFGRPIFASPNPLVWLRNLSRKLRWAILPLRHTYQFVFLLRKPPPFSTHSTNNPM